MMENKIDCPKCGNVSPLKEAKVEIKYKGEVFKVTAYLYKCIPCNLEFTTTESDTQTLSQIPGYPKV